MTYFLATDSRGTQRAEDTSKGWTDRLKELSHHNFTFLRSSVEVHMFSIYALDPFLNTYEDGFFDIMILQSGYNEGIEYYSRGVFEQFVKSHFNPDALVPENTNGKIFRYIDRAAERKIFDLIKRKCKRCVFIGMHCLDNFSVKRSPTYSENARIMNTEFSKLVTDYIQLPEDIDWADKHTKDHIHFNVLGMEYIMEKLKTFIQ